MTSARRRADPLEVLQEDGAYAKESIGWFRHAEIKHGRVAMAAFVGFVVQSNGIHFPWNLQAPLGPTMADVPVISFADIAAAGGPGDQWDALPMAAKLQIFGAIGFLEMWSETSFALKADGQQHYVRGGKPGARPRPALLTAACRALLSHAAAPYPHPPQATSRPSRRASRTRCRSTCGTPSASPGR